MAGAPEAEPDRYVCLNCQAVYAGTPEEDTDPPFEEYFSPEVCSACGDDEFVSIDDYPEVG